MGGWGVTNLVNPDIDTTGNAVTVNIIPSDVIDDTDAVFWIAPQIYRGNKVCLSVCLSVYAYPTFPILGALAYTTGLGYRPPCDVY